MSSISGHVIETSGSAISYPIKARTTTKGTVASGLGTGIEFFIEDSNGISKQVGTLSVELTSASNGQLKSKMVMKTIDEGGDGVASRLEIDDSGAVTIPAGGLTITNGVLSQDDTTDSTSAVTGSIHTDGGVGIAKDLFIGGAIANCLNLDLGFKSSAQSVTPNTDGGASSIILPGITAVDVGAVTNDANDWILLPSLSSVPVGHEITIACNAGTAFEIRTPASSNEKINTVDADGGSAELTAVDTEIIKLTKVSDTDGWIARSFTALGADNGALTPS